MNSLLLTIGILILVSFTPVVIYILMRFGALGWYSGKRRVLRRKEGATDVH
jgi:hypothetical protein